MRFEYHDHLVTFITNRVLQKQNTNWLAVSLTFKQGLPRFNCTVEKLTYEQLSKTVGKIIKNLNVFAYGRAHRRHDKRLCVVPVIERGSSGRMHVHLLIESPPHHRWRISELKAKIISAWKSMRWAHNQSDVRQLSSSEDVVRWTKYILKEHLNSEDALDHSNLYI